MDDQAVMSRAGLGTPNIRAIAASSIPLWLRVIDAVQRSLLNTRRSQ
ncbi:hypothetical protein [Streptomyces sp. NPDC058295]